MKRKPNGPNHPDEVPERLHPALKKFVGYCLYKLGARARARFDARLIKHGLSAPMYIMLRILKLEGKMTQSELGSYMAIDKATMVRLIDGLERQTYVSRVRHGQDRRAKLLELSAAGRRVIGRIEKDRIQAEEQLLAPLTKSERNQLRALVVKVLDVP